MLKVVYRCFKISAGTITYKILKRTADFNIKLKENIPIPQSRLIPLPKRSKLFLEQSFREKSSATGMYNFIFRLIDKIYYFLKSNYFFIL